MESANIISRITNRSGVADPVKFRTLFNLVRCDAARAAVYLLEHSNDGLRVCSQRRGKLFPSTSNVLRVDASRLLACSCIKLTPQAPYATMSITGFLNSLSIRALAKRLY